MLCIGIRIKRRHGVAKRVPTTHCNDEVVVEERLRAYFRSQLGINPDIEV